MAEEERLGKPIGGDLREGKVTLPVILLLQRTGPDVAAMIQGVVDRRPGDARDLADDQGSAARGTAPSTRRSSRAVAYGERAKAHLTGAFAASPERDGLIALTDYVLSRDR